MTGDRGRDVEPIETVEVATHGTGSDAYHVSADRDGDRLTIRGDLPGVTAERTTVEKDGGAVRVAVDDETVGRVPVPFGAARATEVSLNNGVLVVELARAD